MMRRAARPLGRALLGAGAWLLRYGRVEQSLSLRTYQPSARSFDLN